MFLFSIGLFYLNAFILRTRLLWLLRMEVSSRLVCVTIAFKNVQSLSNRFFRKKYYTPSSPNGQNKGNKQNANGVDSVV